MPALICLVCGFAALQISFPLIRIIRIIAMILIIVVLVLLLLYFNFVYLCTRMFVLHGNVGAGPLISICIRVHRLVCSSRHCWCRLRLSWLLPSLFLSAPAFSEESTPVDLGHS